MKCLRRKYKTCRNRKKHKNSSKNRVKTRRSKLKGGTIKEINNSDEFKLNDEYTIELVEEGPFSEFVKNEYGPMYNGVYKFKGRKILNGTERIKEKRYSIFENENKYVELDILEDEKGECGGSMCYFRILMDELQNPVLFNRNANVDTYPDYYYENYIYCRIKPYLDMINASRVSRKNPHKYLPVDVERSIQSFLIENQSI